jgi:CRP/FNR family transcriptional regulator, anaerobic regulatory protein
MSCSKCDCPFQVIRTEDGPFSSVEMQCLLEDAVQHVRFNDGEVLFMQGQPSTCLYAVTDGMVKICTHSPDGREQIVGLSSPDRLLVGLQSISDDRYAYTAIAATDVSACKVNHRTLLARVRDTSDLAMRLIEAVNAQLAHSRALMEVLGRKSAAAKIAAFILLMTSKADRGDRRITLPFSRLELASILGLSEETVCRLMANMKRKGAIHAPRGHIEIRDWGRLQAVADGDSGQPPQLVG